MEEIKWPIAAGSYSLYHRHRDSDEHHRSWGGTPRCPRVDAEHGVSGHGRPRWAGAHLLLSRSSCGRCHWRRTKAAAWSWTGGGSSRGDSGALLRRMSVAGFGNGGQCLRGGGVERCRNRRGRLPRTPWLVEAMSPWRRASSSSTDGERIILTLDGKRNLRDINGH
jgi:hypothetical protein